MLLNKLQSSTDGIKKQTIVLNKYTSHGQTRHENLKISKAYYHKDASASVTKSFLAIHDDFQEGSEQYGAQKLGESSISLSSASSISIANNIHVEPSTKPDDRTFSGDRYVTSASCILFLNNLVEKNFENLQASQSSDELKTLSSYKANNSLLLKNNLSLKALKNASRSSAFLVKRFSLKNLKRSSSNTFNGVESEKKVEEQKLVSKVLSGQSTLSNSNLSNNLKVDKGKRADLSNSTSSYSNISSSNSSQANYSHTNEQTLVNHTNLAIKETKQYLKQNILENKTTSFTQQSDTTDSINSNMSFYISSSKPNNNNTLHNNPSYNNNNLYNQNLLLSKKLRKHLPNSLGLRNHGNTCFMNCILQCLFHTSPLADFFITHQFEHDIDFIIHQKKDSNSANHIPNTNQNLPQFTFTNRFFRLLNSMWKNSYESNLSHELKHLIGHLNSTFSGGTQNDSHELCVWLLDKLSQELSFKLTEKTLSNDSTLNPTSSFVEELFQVEFKSTVVCSKCNYHSSKYETDMMLSLPLPQNQTKSKYDGVKNVTKQQRKPMYPVLILTSQASIKNITANDNNVTSEQSSRSTFYVQTGNQPQKNGQASHSHSSNHYSTPFHAKIGFCIQSAVDSNNGSTSEYMTPNSRINGLRMHISNTYNINPANLVFINLNHIESNLSDDHYVSNSFPTQPNKTNEHTNPPNNDSMCIMELNSPLINNNDSQIPLLNIIGINVYHESSLHEPSEMTRLISYGLPFVLLVNRDCSYSELCRKLLESQSKFFKDKNMLKYKDLVEKLFTLSLSDSGTDNRNRLSPSDELPLYAECVEKAINASQMNMPKENNVEYIKLNIEWQSLDGISNLFKDIDYTRADFIHKSVKNVQKIMELENINNLSGDVEGIAVSSPPSTHSSTTVSTTTLDDCFKLFTEHEHLTDENSWMCPKCQKQTNAYKNLSISQVPPILIIHLKRFFYKSKTSNFKLTTPVWFPVNNLDLSKFIDKSTKVKGSSSFEANPNSDFDYAEYDSSDCDSAYDHDESYMYDLFGVSNHKGTNMANGHYTAYCKNLVDTKWYCFDDANCTPLSDLNQPTSNYNSSNNILNSGSNFVCTEHAYILFYKKRNCMRNERWWTNYVDKTLYEHDEFDRFLHNLDQIELEQRKHQLTQQTQQLRQHLTTNRIQIVSKNNLNNPQQPKKSTGLNKIKNMLTQSTHRKDYDDPISNYQSKQLRTSNIEVNHYDENVKPHRLLKQTHNHHHQQRNESKLSPQHHQQLNSNILTMNTITDIPSSDSNSSLNNSNFIYSKPNANKTNCFMTNIESTNDVYERRVHDRADKDIQHFSGNILYDYPSDNVYKFQLGPNGHQPSHQVEYSPKNICEFQPKHIRSTTSQHLTVNSYLTAPQNSSPVSYQSSNKSLSPNSKSPSSSRYINPATIETPI